MLVTKINLGTIHLATWWRMGVTLFALCVCTSTSRADLYDITFSDGGANDGYGQIDVESGVAVSGTYNVTAGAASGVWTLAPGSGSDGSFNWDNVVNPDSDPFLTGGGLLFTSGGNEINLWGNSPDSYSFYGNIGGNWNPKVDFGTATISAVPEPVNYGLAGFGLIFVADSVGLNMCRKPSAAKTA